MAGSPAPEVSFIIPVRDDAARLQRCLLSIHAAASHPIEIIVCDNGSVDSSRRVAADAGADVIELPARPVAELRNRGAARARAPLLAFVDADHTLADTWLDDVREVFADRTVTAAGYTYGPPDANWVQRAYDRLRVRRAGQHDVDWLGSGTLVVRRTAFEAIGGFDTTLETCEDVDLCNRLRLAGHRLVSDARVGSAHHGDPATLRAVFLGELWRGRDNLRVTLRGPLSAPALLSLAIPAINLACLTLIVAGTLAAPVVGLAVPAAAALASGTLVTLRTLRMTLSSGARDARSLLASLAVAGAYDLGRACALVARATHRTRREAAGDRAHA